MHRHLRYFYYIQPYGCKYIIIMYILPKSEPHNGNVNDGHGPLQLSFRVSSTKSDALYSKIEWFKPKIQYVC